MHHRSPLLFASIALTLSASGAAAQDTGGLEEIVVTAQKVVESLQKVPISIAAVDAETLVRAGADNLDAVQQLTPGMTIAAIGSGFVSYTYIRGAGTNVLTSDAEPSVAYYVDEVYQAGTSGLMSDLLDIERVEVLKGPQGTLFGRNAAAGAVSMTTKRAEETFNAWTSAEVGNYDAWALKGGLTGPISADGKWRYRLALGTRERDGFTENKAGGRDPGFVDQQMSRGSLEYVGDSFTARASADYFTSDNGMTNQSPSTAYAYCGDIMNAAACASLPPGSLPPDADAFHTYYDVDGFEQQDTWSTTLRLEWNLGFATLTSISAYRDNQFDRLADYDATAKSAFVLGTSEENQSFSQELRLSNSADRLSWIAGVFYYDTSTDRLDTAPIGPDFVVPAFAALPGSYHQDLEVKSYAAFGQLTYNFTDAFGVTLGGRYTKDEKDSTQTNDPFGPVPQYTVRHSPEWDSFDPSLSLQYQVNPSLLLYASARQGFKSGGFQSLAGSQAVASNVYDPEEVRSYELGMKSRWMHDRVQLNLAAFRTVIDDQQILRLPQVGVTIIDNAGKTSTDGVDVSFTALPLPELRFDVNATIQKARFDEYDTLVAGQPASYADNHQLRSPDQTVSFTGEYTIPLQSSANVRLRAEYFHQSKVFFDAANSSYDGAFQPGYDVWNGSITYVAPDGTYDVSLYGKNLADEEYYRNVAIQGRYGLAVPGDPMTYGLRFSWRYR